MSKRIQSAAGNFNSTHNIATIIFPNSVPLSDAIGTLVIKTTDTCATAPIPNPNDARDEYILKRRQKGEPWKDIVNQVNATACWERFAHPTNQGRIDAASKAMVRHCERHGINIHSRDHERIR